MEQTNLKELTEEEITKNRENAKKIVMEQTLRLQRLFTGKILERYSINEEKINQYLKLTFTDEAINLINHLFVYFDKKENEFYSKNMNTADLIFNTLSDKRTKVIYLDNIMKKIAEKEENVKSIIEEGSEEIEAGNRTTLRDLFVGTIRKVVNVLKSKEEAEELMQMATHYSKVYQGDVSSTIEKYLESNKNFTIYNIEERMDQEKLRGDKTNSEAKMERAISNNSKKVIDSLLEECINKHKKSSRNELKVCSSSIVDIIFQSLPEEYKSQRDLLEIIVDTNINERLSKLLDEETDALSEKLKAKNHDIIENEFYEEKRYKNIKPYEIELNQIDKVYQDVLHEITIAYDIPETDFNLKKLGLIILSESESTKAVFRNSINSIRVENDANLNQVLDDMNKISKNVSSIAKGNNSLK